MSEEIDPQVMAFIIQFFKDKCEGRLEELGGKSSHWFRIEYGGEIFKVGVTVEGMRDGLWDKATMQIVRKTYANGN